MYTVSLPPIGEGIQEGEIVKWTVKPGDSIRKEWQKWKESMVKRITGGAEKLCISLGAN